MVADLAQAVEIVHVARQQRHLDERRAAIDLLKRLGLRAAELPRPGADD